MDKLTLSELQYNLKRDPAGYETDFERYYEHYQAMEQSFSSAPSQYIENLEQLVMFLSQVVHFYPAYVERFISSILQLLLSRSFGMNPEMRQVFMKAFMRMKTRDLIPLPTAVNVAFMLHRCQDKHVRQTMRNFLISDIKRMNKKQRNNKEYLNVQLFLAKSLKENNPTVARESVLILLRLFKKNVWNDARTANLIAEACLAKRKKVYAPAVRFFLGHEKTPEEKDSDSDSDIDMNKQNRIKHLKLGHRVGCKTKKRDKRLQRSIKNVNKAEERKNNKKESQITNLTAINLLHDAQTFTERLLRKLEHCNDRFEIRLLLLDLISRLIGLNKLVILNFYPFIQRFLRPHQKEVTRLLLFAAQATHDEVPPDLIEPIIRTIADNFITERASSEAIAVGLNSVREICARCPYAVSTDLLSDLVQYRTYKNKNVVSSARSLIRLYRQINPSVLPRKERGRPTEAQLDDECVPDVALSFGQVAAAKSVPGVEALVLAESMSIKAKEKKKQSTEKCTSVDKNVSESSQMDKNSDDENSELSEEDESSSDEDDSNDDEEECEEEEGALDDKAERVVPLNPCMVLGDKVNDCEDDDSGWIDVHHSSDEETSLTAPHITPTELTSKAIEMASTRLFTQEEFEAMRKYQQNKKKRFAALGSRNKRKADTMAIESDNELDDDNDDESGQQQQLVNLSAITRLAKRPRQSKAERLETVQDGRAGREQYGYKVNRMNPHSSTTNREKTKRKTFQMIKHKVKKKMKRSFRDKQIALRDKLKNALKHMRH